MAKKEEKTKIVDDIADKLERSTAVFLTDYRGLTVKEMNDLRGKLRQAGVEYHVVKNTLTRFAAERVGRTAIVPDLEGPTALAFGYGDPVAVARVLNDFTRTSRVLKIKAALMGDGRIAAQDVTRLAELPPADVLRAQLVGAMLGPLASFVGVLNGLLTNIAFAVDQRAKQLEGTA